MNPLRVLFTGDRAAFAPYREALPAALAARGIAATVLCTEDSDWPAESVDYLVLLPSGRIEDFRPYRNCRAALSLWAGVETVVGNPTLTHPLCRMVDPAMTEGMVQWVLAHVLRHHLGTDAYIVNPGHHWCPALPPLPSERRVSVLGLGELGAAVARALARLGFDVAGWSRRPRQIDGIACHAGEAGLLRTLAHTEILVLLLPKTPATESLLDAARLAALPGGAVILNPGRGALIDDAALLAALDRGHIAHATLDAFRVEPLPAGHPFWHHPRVTVSPHVAAGTRPVTASAVIAENVRRSEAGEPLLYLVDRSAGY